MLSIVIPVYRDAPGLGLTLRSLVSNNPDLEDYEIVVGIDGAGETEQQVCEELRGEIPSLRCLPIPKRGGSYRARNLAVDETRGGLLAFLDAGVTVERGWYDALARALKDSDYVAGPVEIPPGWAKSWAERFNAVEGFPVRSYLENHRFGVTANLGIRREVYAAVGPFDDRLHSGGDLEFGSRVHAAGHTQRYEPAMRVLHPPRNLRQLRRKIARVQSGLLDLTRFHPERFGHLRARTTVSSACRRLVRTTAAALLSPRVELGTLPRAGYLAITLILGVELVLANLKLALGSPSRPAGPASWAGGTEGVSARPRPGEPD